MEPNSKECVEHLLRKFKNSVKIFKGYSKDILGKIDIKDIDLVFLDGQLLRNSKRGFKFIVN